jgi:hypothetical protein
MVLPRQRKRVTATLDAPVSTTPFVGESPPPVAEATAEFLHGQLGFTRVLGAYSAHQLFPYERVDRAESRPWTLRAGSSSPSLQ